MTHGFLDGPSTFKPSMKREVVHSDSSGKLFEGNSFAFPVKEASGAGVVALLFARRPSTVSGFIVSVVVDPVKFITRRARPHVCVEGREVVQPFRVDAYPATAVSVVMVVLGVFASILGALPSSVLSGVTHAVSCEPRNFPKVRRTSAALSAAASETSRWEAFAITAGAFAEPFPLLAGIWWHESNDPKKPKCLSQEVVSGRSCHTSIVPDSMGEITNA